MPDLGSAPSKIDTTTLSNLTVKTAINGLQEQPDLTFDAPFDKTTMATINALGLEEFRVAFGEDAVDGGVTFSGEAKAYNLGAEVDALLTMTIAITASTEITPI